MCLRNNDYYSNAKYFSRSNMHRFINNCSCGKCEECLNRKRSEWTLRMYWQARYIFDRPYNAYIVADCLTYAPENRPHLSKYFEVGDDVDFAIVDRKDIQNFLKRLRINLWRRYRVSGDKIKYFIAAEYGDDHIYVNDYGVEKKAQEAPHYHGLFYVDVDEAELSPETFVKELHYAWQKGNTDNYKTFKVRYEHFGLQLKRNIFSKIRERNSDTDLRDITAYISKYIRKGEKYEEFVNKRVYRVFKDKVSRLPQDKLGIQYSEKDIFKDINHEIRQKIDVFHLQSAGFGMYCIDTLSDADRDYMVRSGNLRMNDKKSPSGKREIPIPMYYVRKLFYNYRVVKDDMYLKLQSELDELKNRRDLLVNYYVGLRKKYSLRGKVNKELNSKKRTWIESKIVRIKDKFNSRIDEVREKIRNCHKYDIQWYLTENGLSSMKQMTYYKIVRIGDRYKDWFANLDSDTKDSVLNLLNGRNFYDLATYNLCYRGRILYQYHTSNDNMPTIDDIMDIQNEYNIEYRDFFYRKGDGCVKFTQEKDSFPFDIDGDGNIVDEVTVLPFETECMEKKSKIYRDFYCEYCINENTKFEGEARFRDFDMLLDIIRWTSIPVSDRKQYFEKNMYDIKERLIKLGFKVSQ